MAFKAVSNCLKTGTELVYIGLVMVVPRLVWRVTLFKWALRQIGIYRARPNATRGSPSKWNVAFIARVAYRNPGMAASGMFSQGGYRPRLAGQRPSPPTGVAFSYASVISVSNGQSRLMP